MQLIKLMCLIEFVVITTMERKVNEDRRAFTALLSYVRLNFSEKGSFLLPIWKVIIIINIVWKLELDSWKTKCTECGFFNKLLN